MDEIRRRVSVRDFLPDPVSEDDVRALTEAAMCAPSAMNQQCWEFVVVDDPGLIAGLSEASPYAKPVGRAPLAIVIAANRDRIKVPDMWQQDLGACTENLLLEATSRDLGAVWIGIAPVAERMDLVSGLLGLPDGVMPFCIVAVGHPRGEVPGKSRWRPELVHRNGYRLGP